MIMDGTMLPFFSYGDYVGGSKKIGNNVSSFLGFNCIIELKDVITVSKIISLNQGLYTI